MGKGKTAIRDVSEVYKQALPEYCLKHCLLIRRNMLNVVSMRDCKRTDELDDLFVCNECNWNDEVVEMKKKLGQWQNIPAPITCANYDLKSKLYSEVTEDEL